MPQALGNKSVGSLHPTMKTTPAIDVARISNSMVARGSVHEHRWLRPFNIQSGFHVCSLSMNSRMDYCGLWKPVERRQPRNRVLGPLFAAARASELQTVEELRELLEALQAEAEQVRGRANSTRARFMRLTDVVEQLRQRAAIDVRIGNETSARFVLHEKQKVMKALELSKQRAQVLQELSAKLNEAISIKETQLISALSCARLDLATEGSDTSMIRVVSPREEDKELTLQMSSGEDRPYSDSPGGQSPFEESSLGSPNEESPDSSYAVFGAHQGPILEDSVTAEMEKRSDSDEEHIEENETHIEHRNVAPTVRCSPENSDENNLDSLTKCVSNNAGEHFARNGDCEILDTSEILDSPSSVGAPMDGVIWAEGEEDKAKEPYDCLVDLLNTETVNLQQNMGEGKEAYDDSGTENDEAFAKEETLSGATVPEYILETQGYLQIEEVWDPQRETGGFKREYVGRKGWIGEMENKSWISTGISYERYMEKLDSLLDYAEFQLQSFLEEGEQGKAGERVETVTKLLEQLQSMRTR